MKVITDKGLQHLETMLFATVTNDRFDFKIKFLYDSLMDMSGVIPLLQKEEIVFIKEGRYLSISQTELLKLFNQSEIEKFFKEERVWPTTGGELIPTKDMDHQRLSNCIGLLDLLLSKEKIDKESADVYLNRLQDSIVPEIEERFKGEVLDYQPYFEWEKKLAAE